MKPLRQNIALKMISSLRLTVILLSCSMLLVFMSTLDQVRMGIRGAQKEYFESLYHLWEYPEQWIGGESLHWLLLPIPGGYLVGPLLFVNLVAAHVQRFQLTWKKAGIQCIHLGVILLLLGQLCTQLFQVESKMLIYKGKKANFISRWNEVELAFTNDEDKVVVIPQAILEKGGTIRNADLPFSVRIIEYGPNCKSPREALFNGELRAKSQDIETLNLKGAARELGIEIENKEEDFGSNGENYAWVILELMDPNEFIEKDGKKTRKSLGKWISIAHPNGRNDFWELEHPHLKPLVYQEFLYGRKVDDEVVEQLWWLELRNKREYLPYSIELVDLTNEYYKGTGIPKNFESEIRIHEGETADSSPRGALVYMNHPLRYDGKTFYQHQMGTASTDYTVFQVVENPGWLTPYAACILVSIGLLWQFGYHLVRFLRKVRS